MRADIVATTAGLKALIPEWDALWRRTPNAAPFQSPHWLVPWWEVFGNECPRVVAVRRDGVLAGLLPAYILDEPQGRKLLPIGAGTTDYLDLLGDGAEVALQVLLHRAGEEAVDRCDLIDIRAGSPLRSARPPAGWRVAWSDDAACPVLRLGSVPAAMRRKLRMNRNRADRAGGRVTETACAGTLASAIDALAALHHGRWSDEGQPGVMSEPGVLEFHRRAAPRLLDAGLLRLCLLRVGGAVAAANLALLGADAIYFYLSGYDTARRFVSPGSLLLGAMLEDAAAEGRSEAHFLRGREPYKYAWGAVDRLNASGRFALKA